MKLTEEEKKLNRIEVCKRYYIKNKEKIKLRDRLYKKKIYIKKEYLPISCINCNNLFTPKSKKHKACSELCQQQHWYKQGTNLLKQTTLFKTRRQKTKLKCIDYKGGKCAICGYNKHPCALDFHHIDETTKEHDITKLIRNNNWEEIVKELSKCILVCSNCHRELHFKIYEEL